jgi:hypothetical protein
MRHLKRLVFVQPVFGDELGQEGAVHAPGNVVPGGNGKEGAGVVVEPNRIVEPCRLG